MLTLELVVEQNTKMVERLDRSMAQLCQAMADLRVQMIQGQAELRQEIALSQAELRKEMADGQAQLRQEIAHSHQQLHVFFERKFMWLISAYCGGFFTLIGFMAKYFLDSYAK